MEVKVAICPVCLENLNDGVIFCSDGYLYDQKCFDGLNLISPITREKITYYIPFERINDNIVRFEKECRNNTTLLIYNSAGFNQYGFDKEGFDKNGFNKFGFNKEGIDIHGFNEEGFGKKGFDREGFNKEGFDKDGFNKEGFDKDGLDREKKLADPVKVREMINKNPWYISYVSESARNNYEIMKECIVKEPKTYKYASPKLKTNINLAKTLLLRRGSFNLLSRNIRNNKEIAILAVKFSHINYRHLTKNLKDDDEIFEIAVKLNKEAVNYASERLRAIYQSINDLSN